MAKYFAYVLTLLLTVASTVVLAQSEIPDSIQQKWSVLPQGEDRIDLMLEEMHRFEESDYQLSTAIARLALAESKELNYDRGITDAYEEIGISLSQSGEFQEAIATNREAIVWHREQGDSINVASGYNRIAANLNYQGLFDSAMPYQIMALRIQESENDSAGRANSMNNIGYTYWNIGEIEKATEYFQGALSIMEALDDVYGVASVYTNLGIMLALNDKKEQAKGYFEQGIATSSANGFQSLMAINYSNLGELQMQSEEYLPAIGNLQHALEVNRSIGNKRNIINTLKSLAACYNLSGQPGKAIPALEESIALADSLASPQMVTNSYLLLANAYEARGNYREALKNHRIYLAERDSMLNNEKIIEINKLEADYLVEMEQLENDTLQKALALRDLTISEQDARDERNFYVMIALTGGLLIAIVAAILIFRVLRQNKRAYQIIATQKTEVERQREEAERQREEAERLRVEADRQRLAAQEQQAIVEEKNREIVDSIQYARRLQEAILPPQELIQAELKDWFIFYRPKDIVSGDFYWMARKDKTLLFAVADCTGHGVPGAMVSVVGANGLNRCVKEFGLTDPGAILDRLSLMVEESFSSAGNAVRDGMDISLCSWNQETGTFQFAGANNPLYLFRTDGGKGLRVNERQQIPALSGKNGLLYAIKGDKQPVGKHENRQPFKTLEVEAEPGDRLFLFSDGFSDQFGGAGNKPGGKKFKSANFRKLIDHLQGGPLAEQQHQLQQTFDNWKGDFEQIDDVCVFGLSL